MYLRKFILLIAVIFVFVSCEYIDASSSLSESSKKAKLSVNFIDVGQGDSVLIESGGKYMLIDAGENDKGGIVCDYIKKEGAQELEYVIGTHPHSDHIGGLDTVINNFDIKTLIMPNKTANTKTFEDVIAAAENKNLKITPPVVGDEYTLGNAQFTIIAPVKDDYGDEANNYSVGIKLVCGENSFVMCGDAEKEAESDIISTGIDLKADVLKLGHHGSSTSSSAAFLDAVSPSYAVIMCAKDNKYGHPHKETLAEMEKRAVNVLRTDLSGTITALSDGKSISWEMSEAEDNPSESGSDYYVLNTKTKKFHNSACSSAESINASNKEISNDSRENLIAQGYSPCKTCNP